MVYPLGTGSQSGVVSTDDIGIVDASINATRVWSQGLNFTSIPNPQNRSAITKSYDVYSDILFPITGTRVWNTQHLTDLNPTNARSTTGIRVIDVEPIVQRLPLAHGVVNLRTYTGSITPAGVLSNKVLKNYSGSALSSGTVTKSSTHSFSGILTPSSFITKLVERLLDGSVVPTGLESFLLTRQLLLNGSIQPDGFVTYIAAFHLVGELSPSSEVTKDTSTIFSGSVAPSSTNLLSLGGVNSLGVGANVFPSGHVTFLITQNFSGSTTPAGLNNDTGKISPNGTLVPSGSESLIALKILTSLVGPSGINHIHLSRSLVGLIVPTGSYHSTFVHLMTGNVPNSGTVVTKPLIVKAGSITPTSTLDMEPFIIYSSVPGFIYED